MPRQDSQTQLGRSIGERYLVVRWLGEGGHGWVYEAEDRETGARVAVKVVKPSHASDLAQSRLEDEANASRRVDHPGVARILAVGEDGGDAYVVMELVDGPTLRAFRSTGETFSKPTVTDVFLPLTDAVAAVHRAGLVHRDLKPSNVGLVIGPSGRPSPKLLDFGMAKAIDGDGHTTTSGRILGTPHYMSPEQALGEPTNDPRVDVWALGVMIYECIEGQRPYGGASATAVLMNILRLEPRPLSQRNRDTPLGALVMRALDRDIERRFQDAGAMHEALARALADEWDEVTEPGRKRTEKRGKLLLVGATMVATAIATAVIWGATTPAEPEASTGPAPTREPSVREASPTRTENRPNTVLPSTPETASAVSATSTEPLIRRVPNVRIRDRVTSGAPPPPRVEPVADPSPVAPPPAPPVQSPPGLLRRF